MNQNLTDGGLPGCCCFQNQNQNQNQNLTDSKLPL